mmetsp:Transcript_16810/g.23545  ORF Transcript_16810/g.23545 Transcript_16810/m.23545 type:complete len:352 (-) Transcript_16810:94-1149(-)|eukprot:CAMPEP_0184490348 /NCGR_PEP_ID=MMETSP0113_2-20130426/17682_1 /TAXON_ID=91329 /ORGANISM="Norrisiella sphaerica, Strain BC52" /LENGTH=351 /DNA_ID=CAMNT_0026874193 /DNA_START=105 /DNA_END=1160 /DNA_ORIENTATION=+
MVAGSALPALLLILPFLCSVPTRGVPHTVRGRGAINSGRAWAIARQPPVRIKSVHRALVSSKARTSSDIIEMQKSTALQVRQARKTASHQHPQYSLATRPNFRFQRYEAPLSRSVRAKDGLFGVGPFELFVSLGLALVLVGPEGLINIARAVAQFIRDLQPAIRELAESSSEITETINKELGLDEITETIFTAQRELQSAQDELTQTLRDATVKQGVPPPPPPPPPMPTMTSLENLEEAKEEIETQEEDDFVPPTAEEIEELKKPKFWSPREEADATQGIEKKDLSGAAETKGKLDGAAVFQKAMALAEEKQQADAVAASSSGKKLMELSEEQIELLRKAEAEAAKKRQVD